MVLVRVLPLLVLLLIQAHRATGGALFGVGTWLIDCWPDWPVVAEVALFRRSLWDRPDRGYMDGFTAPITQK